LDIDECYEPLLPLLIRATRWQIAVIDGPFLLTAPFHLLVADLDTAANDDTFTDDETREDANEDPDDQSSSASKVPADEACDYGVQRKNEKNSIHSAEQPSLGSYV
jgi:hypothetical protein